MIITRRSFLAGLLAAPIVVRTGIIMPVKPLIERPVLRFRKIGYQLHGEDWMRQVKEIWQENLIAESRKVSWWYEQTWTDEQKTRMKAQRNA